MNKPSKALIKEWYDKLKDDGFEDIEYMDSQGEPYDVLKNDSHKHIQKWQEQGPTVEEYYRLARHLVYHGKFKNKVHKQIWILHTEGVSIRKIAKELKKARAGISKIIKSYRPQMYELQFDLDQDPSIKLIQ